MPDHRFSRPHSQAASPSEALENPETSLQTIAQTSIHTLPACASALFSEASKPSNSFAHIDSLSAEQRASLEHYCELVQRYQASMNLISPKALEQLPQRISESYCYAVMLQHITQQDTDLIAELATATANAENSNPGLQGLDLGSGVGLPAIALLVALPQYRWLLVERRSKRASFLRIVLAQLSNLPTNYATVVSEDVRQINSPHWPAVHIISAQAVGRLAELYALTRHLHAAHIVLLSRKGRDWPEEVAELQARTGAALQVYQQALARDGTLIGVSLRGGLPCPLSV